MPTPGVLGMPQQLFLQRSSDVVIVGAGTDYQSRTSNLRSNETRTERAMIIPMALNKSCDACGIRKRKCDGNRPCSRCVGKGVGNTCNFSRRKPHKPHKPHKPRRRVSYAPALTVDSTATSYSPGVQYLKRCRLSASPATGLVGMVENDFLSDYFAGFGFLPLTSESQIRETIVRMMILAGKKRRSDMVTGPSMCTFWCAVALGALIKGTPVESVERYFRLAKDLLDRFSGPPTPEAIGAYTILGYVHGFVGDNAGLSRCLQRAGSFIQAFTNRNQQNQLPVGLAEAVQFVESANCKINALHDEASYAEEIIPPQMSPFPTEGEVYRYLTLMHRAIEQAYAKVTTEQDAGGLFEVKANGFETTRRGRNEDGDYAASEGHERFTGLRAVMEKFEESSFDLHMMEDALERPGIRSGVGGFIINMTLSIASTFKKDPCRTLERANNSLEVLERYPGLFRFIVWSHYGHYIALLFKIMDGSNARESYDRIRTAFNPVRPPEFKAMPPFDEWHGVESICVEACCRESEAALKMEFGPNTVEDPESIGLENGEDSPLCGSWTTSDPGADGAFASPWGTGLVHEGVDYQGQDAEDGLGPGPGVSNSPQRATPSPTAGDQRLVSPHQLPLAKPSSPRPAVASHWNGEMKSGASLMATGEMECNSDTEDSCLDSTTSADRIAAEDWSEVVHALNL